jgi:hypothetical protein
MSDTYQAVYDATRSKIGRVDGQEIVRAASEAFDISHAKMMLQQEIGCIGMEMVRPSVLFRPTVAPDGNKWCALYGPNLMEGVSGFGDTPDEAMRDFDQKFNKERTPVAVQMDKAGAGA